MERVNEQSATTSIQTQNSHGNSVPIIPGMRFLTLGHNPIYAQAMETLQLDLQFWIRNLHERRYERRIEISLIPMGNLNDVNEFPAGLLVYDDLLFPLWREFSLALATLGDDHGTARGYDRIILEISCIHLSKEVLDVLTPALTSIPINGLILNRNAFGAEGIEMVATIMESNTTIDYLDFCNNELEQGEDYSAIPRFCESIRSHPRLLILEMSNCGLGLCDEWMSEFVPAFTYSQSLRMLSLKQNNIGSATLLSFYLASNPRVHYLWLDDNDFNDRDAELLAQSLRYNSRLRHFGLMGNNFSSAGYRSLLNTISDTRSLNAIHDSNHTCHLDLFDELKSVPEDVDLKLLNINQAGFPAGCKKQKIFNALLGGGRGRGARRRERRDIASGGMMERDERGGDKKDRGDESEFGIHFLNDVPFELMPNVLAFINERDPDPRVKDQSLNRVFNVMREWQMPWLFMNNSDDENKL